MSCHPERRRQFLTGQALTHLEFEHRTLVLVEPFSRLPDERDRSLALERSIRLEIGSGVVDGSEITHDRTDGIDGDLLRSPLAQPSDPVAGDGEEPRTELRPIAQLVEPLPRSHERVGQRILCESPIAGEREAQREDAIRVTVVQLGERALIAVYRCSDEGCVVHRSNG